MKVVDYCSNSNCIKGLKKQLNDFKNCSDKDTTENFLKLIKNFKPIMESYLNKNSNYYNIFNRIIEINNYPLIAKSVKEYFSKINLDLVLNEETDENIYNLFLTNIRHVDEIYLANKYNIPILNDSDLLDIKNIEKFKTQEKPFLLRLFDSNPENQWFNHVIVAYFKNSKIYFIDTLGKDEIYNKERSKNIEELSKKTEIIIEEEIIKQISGEQQSWQGCAETCIAIIQYLDIKNKLKIKKLKKRLQLIFVEKFIENIELTKLESLGTRNESIRILADKLLEKNEIAKQEIQKIQSIKNKSQKYTKLEVFLNSLYFIV